MIRLLRRCFMSLVVCVCGLMVVPLSAGAAGGPPAPGWEASGVFSPTDLPPGGDGVLRLYVYDIGAERGNGEDMTLVDQLPAGLEAAREYAGGAASVSETAGCSGTQVVTCKLIEASPGPGPEVVAIPVHVAVDASNASAPVDRVSVRGGGALGSAEDSIPVVFGSGVAPAGFANADLWVSNADGTVDRQAGSHPYAVTMAFATNALSGEGFERPATGEAQALNVNLPPGLVGDPSAVPQCPRWQFDGEECPADTQIGEDLAAIGGLELSHAGLVYNLIPPPGVAAEFAFDFDGTHAFLDARVRSGGDYGITEYVEDVPQLQVMFNTIQIWGVPGEHGTGAPLKPFLTLPTSCGASPVFSAEMLGTWQEPEAVIPPVKIPWHDNEGNPVGITGCEKLVHFQPSISLAPDTSFSDTPAGLSATVKIPQGLNPEGLATSGLKEATVVLPEGMSINPGQATGLVACQPSQENLPLERQDGEAEVFDGPAECPAASKVGTDEIATPLLHSRLKGNIYVLQSNPPEVKLLLAASGEGVNIKLVGTVQLDEATGRITTTFKGTERYPGTPDAPVNEIVVSFSGGAQAALITPPTCNVYPSTAVFTPWASPLVEDALAESSFQITSGPNGSGRAGCTAPLPFAPTLTAGSTTDQAGGFTGFSMLLERPDGQQRIKGLQFKIPEGLSGMISKVPLCPEPQADDGDCPAASQIGHTIAGVGAGPYPFYLPQAGQPPAPIYLTGPHDGAPFGLSIVVPVIAGPFNLGLQVIRASIAVDPITAQITVTVDPTGPYSIPTILKGVPADLRSINAVIDRPGFMFNPTNCNPMAFTGTATSTQGTTAALSYRFQVGSCQALKFKPDFKVSTQAKASRANGESLDVKVVYPAGELGANQATSQANIHRVRVELPKLLPSRLTTLQKACSAAMFDANPAGCPAASIVGEAKAITPLLPVPVSGPAYFVSHGGEAFPSLILVLQGDGVTVDLIGTTFISKKGVTSTTFKEVPDVPVTSFELKLPKGPHSALAANVPAKDNYNLCGQKLTMPTEMTGQNGAVIKQETAITITGCPNSVSIESHSVKKRTLTVSVSVPAAGKLTASGKGLSKVSKSSSGAETLKLSLSEKKAGKLSTRIMLSFIPKTGKKLTKDLTVKFK